MIFCLVFIVILWLLNMCGICYLQLLSDALFGNCCGPAEPTETLQVILSYTNKPDKTRHWHPAIA